MIKTIECYKKALEIEPCLVVAWYNMGISYDTLESHYEAIKCYDKAIEINPMYENAHQSKGHSLGKLGKYKEAFKLLDKALEINLKMREHGMIRDMHIAF